MAKKGKYRFAYDLSLLGLLVFIIVNVWLSLVIKNLKNEVYEKDGIVKWEQAEVLRAHQHINAFQDVFCMNMGLRGAKVNKPVRHKLQSMQNGQGVMLLLHLDEYACSECNMHIINWLVKRNSGFNDFRIVSHSSNAFYLDEMYHEGVIPDPSIIVWYDDALYDESLPGSTADLLFIDRHYVIQAMLPLDKMNDACLFEEYLQCANKSFAGSDLLR